MTHFVLLKLKLLQRHLVNKYTDSFMKERHVLPPTVEEVETYLNNDVNDLQQNQLNKQESLNITGRLPFLHPPRLGLTWFSPHLHSGVITTRLNSDRWMLQIAALFPY